MLTIDKFKAMIETALYPTNPKCAFCGRNLIFDTGMICSGCRRHITFIGENTCIKCGDNLDENAEHQLCERCRRTHFLFEGGVSVFVYDEISKEIIFEFKYRNNPYGAYCCGLLLADKSMKTTWFKDIDIITCVPASKDTLRKRGYNQSEIIAGAFKEKCDIMICNDLMLKKHDLKDQIGLDIRQRQENMKDAFEVTDPALTAGKKILVVDDVMTTGATMNACSDVLIKAGAAKVYSAAVASAFINKT